MLISNRTLQISFRQRFEELAFSTMGNTRAGSLTPSLVFTLQGIEVGTNPLPKNVLKCCWNQVLELGRRGSERREKDGQARGRYFVGMN